LQRRSGWANWVDFRTVATRGIGCKEIYLEACLAKERLLGGLEFSSNLEQGPLFVLSYHPAGVPILGGPEM